MCLMGLGPRALAQSQVDAPVAKTESRSDSKGSLESIGDTATKQPSFGTGSTNTLLNLGKDFLEDQKQVVTSPARLRFIDADWLVPAAGLFTGLLTTDRDFSTHLSTDPTTMNHRSNLSNA